MKLSVSLYRIIHTKRYFITSVLIILALLVIFINPHLPPTPQTKYNIVWVVVDTLRADHMGLYRYERNTTPNIDEFAKDAIIFTNAIAPATWTYASFTSFLSSQYPRSVIPNVKNIEQYLTGTSSNTSMFLSESGETQLKEQTTKYFAYPFTEKDIIQAPIFKNTVSEHFLTLANTLKSHNYTTGAFAMLPPLFFAPIDNDFSTYDTTLIPDIYEQEARGNTDRETFDPKTLYQDRELNQRISQWLETRKEPFFLLIDYQGPHCPYWVPEEFDVFRTKQDVDLYDIAEKTYGCGDLTTPLSKELTQSVKNAYDGKVLATDKRIGELLQKLREFRLEENTIIIITGDHGEELGDHFSYLSHTESLYQSVLNVPLIVKIPSSVSPKTIPQRVSLIDIAPTLLEILDVPAPKQFEGKSVMPLIRGEETADRTVFAAAGPHWDLSYSGFAILDGDYKLMSGFIDPKEDKLYNLVSDPREKENLLLEYPRIARALKEKLINNLLDSVEKSQASADYTVEQIKKKTSDLRQNTTTSHSPYDASGENTTDKTIREDILKALKGLGYTE